MRVAISVSVLVGTMFGTGCAERPIPRCPKVPSSAGVVPLVGVVPDPEGTSWVRTGRGKLSDESRRREGSGSSTPDPECRMESDSLGVTEIDIERDTCFGPCPVYSLRLRSNGSVSYDGEAFVKPLGHRTGRMNPYDFATLAQLAVEIGYFELDDYYACAVTDNPTVPQAARAVGLRCRRRAMSAKPSTSSLRSMSW